MIDTLDAHQGAAATILTAALVAVTIYYAAQNRAMVDEMRRARDASLLPKLALDFRHAGPTVVMLTIKNVGPGAALNVDVTTVWDPIEPGAAPESRWRRNVLVSGEHVDFFPPGESLGDNLNWLPALFQRARLVGSMEDAAGKRHAVNEVFDDLAEWRAVLLEARQRYVSPDPEKRLADELSKQFKSPFAEVRRGLSDVAGAVRDLERSEDEVAG